MNKKLYSVKEVSESLGISKAKVYELINCGFLKAMDLGGLKVPEYIIDEFISKYSGYSFKDINNIAEFQTISLDT